MCVCVGAAGGECVDTAVVQPPITDCHCPVHGLQSDENGDNADN